MNDLVSIIMPSYNTGRFITETLRSVQQQTYQNWELLLVDDCSADDTHARVAELADARIRFLQNPCNSGAAVSRNRALREAKGRWIAFLDSDDIWLPEKLEKQLAFMQAHEYAFSYTRYREIDEHSQPNGWHVGGPQVVTRAGMYRFCWLGCLTVMYDAQKIGLIQICDIKKNNDYAMWLQVCKKSNCYLLDEELALYRIREGSISNRSYVSLIRWHYRLFRQADGRGKLPAAVLTCRNLFYGTVKKLFWRKKERKSGAD